MNEFSRTKLVYPCLFLFAVFFCFCLFECFLFFSFHFCKIVKCKDLCFYQIEMKFSDNFLFSKSHRLYFIHTYPQTLRLNDKIIFLIKWNYDFWVEQIDRNNKCVTVATARSCTCSLDTHSFFVVCVIFFSLCTFVSVFFFCSSFLVLPLSPVHISPNTYSNIHEVRRWPFF